MYIIMTNKIVKSTGEIKKIIPFLCMHFYGYSLNNVSQDLSLLLISYHNPLSVGLTEKCDAYETG